MAGVQRVPTAAACVGADATHRVRVSAHRAGAPPLAGDRQRLRVARLAADVSVGAACADHAGLRAREQLVAADVRVVAAESLSLALLPAVELSKCCRYSR